MEVAEVVRRTAYGLGASAVRDVQVLARRDGANLVLALTTLPGGARVVAKARTGPSGCDGTRAATALRAVERALPLDGPLAVPRVLLHDPDRGLLVTEHVPGGPLHGADGRPAGARSALRRAGAALAALHALPAVVGPTVRLADCLADLVRPQPHVLCTALPGLRDSVHDLLTAVLAAEPAPPVARPLHRDVHLRQLLDDGHRTWLLDWDLAAQGDPALDVGNLVASLRSKSVEPADVQAFLTGYATGDRTGALARVAVYEAFTFLRLACKRFRLDGPVARPQVERLLAAGRLALDGSLPQPRQEALGA